MQFVLMNPNFCGSGGKKKSAWNAGDPGLIPGLEGFQKNIYFCFIDYAKAFDCVDHNKLL